ncbi:MAG: hypothetical protein IJ809_05215 [Clostridia bacterium]|nr:hypothetical protein [Clostridia bacterium]
MVDFKEKKGVSLIILIITIAIILIITSIVILSSDDSRKNAVKTAYIADLTNIESSVKAYYLLNGTFPTLNSNLYKTSYSEAELLALNPDTNLSGDIILNQDTNSTYYIIDLSVLDVKNVGYGKKYAETNSLDVFVVSSSNMNIYYLKGRKIDDVPYYSLSTRLTGNVLSTSESQNAVTNNLSLSNSVGKIKSVYEYNSDTNKSVYKVIVELANSEQIEVKTDENTYNPLSTVGSNVYTLEELLSSAQLLEVKQTGKFTVKILKNSVVVEEKELDVILENELDMSFLDNDEVTFNESDNTLKFRISKGNGKITVKYEYYNVFDEENALGYSKYSSELDTNEKVVKYVKSVGKFAQAISSDTYEITVPKNVRDVFIVMEDSSGNTIYTTKTLFDFYAKATLLNTSNSLVNINVSTVAPNSTNVKISCSQDGKTFSAPSSYTTSSIVYLYNIGLSDITADYVYVKTVINISGTEYSFVDKLEVK